MLQQDIYPELLFCYAGNVNNIFVEQEFSFSNKFFVVYDKVNRTLKINKNSDFVKGFWHERILNISLVVGQNGSGKTTLLNMIGYKRTDRRAEFNRPSRRTYGRLYSTNEELKAYKQNKNCWFLLYHITDNIFILEGFKLELISNIKGLPEVKKDKIPIVDYNEYSLIVEYDNGDWLYKGLIQSSTMPESGSIDKYSVIIYKQHGLDTYETRKGYRLYEEDYTYSFERIYTYGKRNLADIYKFITQHIKTLNFEINVPNIKMSILSNNNKHINNDEYSKSNNLLAELDIYNKKVSTCLIESNKLLDSDNKWYIHLTVKEKLILRCMESYIFDTWLGFFKSERYNLITLKDNVEKIILNDLNFNDLFNHLVDIIKYISEIAGDNAGLSKKENLYHVAFLEFLETLLNIEESTFKNDTIEIDMSSYNPDVEKMLLIYDKYELPKYRNFNNLHSFFSGNISGLSTGELRLFSIFAEINTSLQSLQNNFQGKIDNKYLKSICFVFDEPDESFHPEWSRQFIYLLVNYISILTKRDDLKFQFIISTHSPIMLSDVNVENIVFLEQENGRCISKFNNDSQFNGFGSNIHDIMRNSFFMKKTIGAFANDKISKIIEFLLKKNENEKPGYLNENNYKLFNRDELYNIIQMVGEPVIKVKLKELYYEKYGMTREQFDVEKNRLENELKILQMKYCKDEGLDKNDKD